MGKLIRDKIPQLVREAGGAIETRTLNESEFEVALREKLVEEANEVALATSDSLLEELGDVVTVLAEIARHHGYTLSDVTDAAAEKRQAAGGFDKQLLSERFTPQHPTAQAPHQRRARSPSMQGG